MVLQPGPDSTQPLSEIPLTTPADCSFWSLTAAPVGSLLAVEWQCAYGPAVQVLDTLSGKVHFLLDDPSMDYRLLAWNPDGKSIYLKAGMLSQPQVLRVDVESRHKTVLPLSPNTYNLSVSPDSTRMLHAFSNGMGLGSELWLSDTNGAGGRKILSDAENILGLMRYSPDAEQIAYIRLPDSESAFPAGELWVMDSGGENARLAATADAGRGMPPVWSPDGQKIAFIGRDRPDDHDSINLSIYDPGTSQLITSPFSLLTPPVWSPDGSNLYFTLRIDDKMEVWFYETSTGKTRKLLDGACCAGWLR